MASDLCLDALTALPGWLGPTAAAATVVLMVLPTLRQLRQRSLVRLIGRDRLEPTEAVLYSLDLSPNAREERP